MHWTDVSDFECIVPVGNIGDNICSQDNSVTQETNTIDHSVTDNSDDDTTISDSFNDNSVTDNSDNSDHSVTISDSYNTSCGNGNTFENSSANNVTCEVANGVSAIAPSTLGLS